MTLCTGMKSGLLVPTMLCRAFPASEGLSRPLSVSVTGQGETHWQQFTDDMLCPVSLMLRHLDTYYRADSEAHST